MVHLKICSRKMGMCIFDEYVNVYTFRGIHTVRTCTAPTFIIFAGRFKARRHDLTPRTIETRNMQAACEYLWTCVCRIDSHHITRVRLRHLYAGGSWTLLALPRFVAFGERAGVLPAIVSACMRQCGRSRLCASIQAVYQAWMLHTHSPSSQYAHGSWKRRGAFVCACREAMRCLR
jgi:hypothetical protein